VVSAPPPVPQAVRFGPFELDLRSGELRREGRRVSLQDQPFQVLVVLLEHPGEQVGREELRARLWPSDTYVDFEHGLNAAVKRLRDALGDSSETPRFVETVLRRGYRFVAPVDGAAPLPAAGGRRWSHSAMTIGAAAVVLAVGAALFLRTLERGRSEGGPTEACPHPPDVRARASDRTHLVAGRPLYRVQLRPGGQLRHLGAAGGWGRRRPGDQGPCGRLAA
jgi:DNA-binding winged helix-turn-helix (wHTH) protein